MTNMKIFDLFNKKSKYLPTVVEPSGKDKNGVLSINFYNNNSQLCAELKTINSFTETVNMNEEINKALDIGFYQITLLKDWVELEKIEEDYTSVLTLINDKVMGMNRFTQLLTKGENRKIALKHASIILNLKK